MELQDAGLREAGYGQTEQQDAETRGCGVWGCGIQDMVLCVFGMGGLVCRGAGYGCEMPGSRDCGLYSGQWEAESPALAEGFPFHVAPLSHSTEVLGTAGAFFWDKGIAWLGNPFPSPSCCQQ